MHDDDEPDTFVYMTWPQKVSKLLGEIGVNSDPKEVGTDEVESDEYYSRHFASTPRMVTNRGCVDVKDTNIDVIHIIQKG